MAPALPPRVRFCSLCGAGFDTTHSQRGGTRCTPSACAELPFSAAPEAPEDDPPITGAEVAAVVGDAFDLAAGLANVARQALKGLAKVNDRAGGAKREGPIPR